MSLAANLRRAIAALDPLDTVLRLTLLELLLRPPGVGAVRLALLALACSGLLSPRALRSSALWLALALLAGWRIAADWPLPDNHAYLLAYWCLAIGLALPRADAAASLASTSRLLVGLVFAFAALWKLALSPDFVDGTFLRVALLDDPRFEPLVRLAGGLDVEQLATARRGLRQHVDGSIALVALPAFAPRFHALAALGTGFLGVLEPLLALTFLAPDRPRLRALRDGLLVLFCVTTQAIATVAGFGWLLVALGLAGSAPERERARAAYLATFALILLYRELPWGRLLSP